LNGLYQERERFLKLNLKVLRSQMAREVKANAFSENEVELLQTGSFAIPDASHKPLPVFCPL